jgi:glutamyl-tRNA reductase
LDGLLLAVNSPEPLITPKHASGLRMVVDLSLPSVLASGLERVPELTVLQLDDIGRIAAREAESRSSAADIAMKMVSARAKQIHRELDSGRVHLGTVIQRHVNNAMDELEQAFSTNLAHLTTPDRKALKQVLERLARRNAHFHIQDLKEMA